MLEYNQKAVEEVLEAVESLITHVMFTNNLSSYDELTCPHMSNLARVFMRAKMDFKVFCEGYCPYKDNELKRKMEPCLNCPLETYLDLKGVENSGR